MGRYQYQLDGGDLVWADSPEDIERSRPNQHPRLVAQMPRADMAVAPRDVVRVPAHDPAVFVQWVPAPPPVQPPLPVAFPDVAQPVLAPAFGGGAGVPMSMGDEADVAHPFVGGPNRFVTGQPVVRLANLPPPRR